jgi:tetratricopeptide (TPR) repeat protein
MSQTSPGPDLDIGQTLARAHAHWNAGQADQAEMACQRVLAVWPAQPDAMHLLGLMAHTYGNLDLAIAHIRKACESPRAPALYYSNLAEMCRQRGLLAEGEQAGRRAVALNPQLANGWNNLGIILQESGKLDESRTCLERVLMLEPENAQAHNNLGNTCKRLGLTTEAEQYWAKAVALRPNYAEVYSNLSNLLTERAEFDRARDMARKAIELNPRLADAYVNLAGAETAQQNHGEAQRWLRNLLSFAPDHVSGLTAMALSLKQTDDLDTAADMARRAVTAGAQNAEAHNALGSVLQAQGQKAAAFAEFDLAAKLPGTAREQSLLNQASLHLEFGDKTSAQTGFEAVLGEYPGSVSALFNLSSLKKTSAGDTLVAAMESRLASGPALSANDRMMLHFGLGKALMDAGQSDAAFRHLGIGNKLKRGTIGYDPDGVTRWLKSIAAAYPTEKLAAGGDGDPSTMPIFVLGMPRSGTTLVEQILASHPAIHGAGELRLVQQVIDRLGPFPDSAANLPPAKLKELGAAYVAHVTRHAGGRPHVVDKMPANFLYIGLIRQILPQARIVHCRRDPVDTCLSCYGILFAGEQNFSYDQSELGRFWRDYDALIATWRPGLPATHYLEVQYEDVVDDLDTQARRMLAFLGLPWNDSVLDFHQTNRPVRTASLTQVREPIYRSSVGKWRGYSTQLQPLLTALGISE